MSSINDLIKKSKGSKDESKTVQPNKTNAANTIKAPQTSTIKQPAITKHKQIKLSKDTN